MATTSPAEVSRQAIQHDLGALQKRHTRLGVNLPYLVISCVLLLFGLALLLYGLYLKIAISPDNWGNFSPQIGVLFGLACLFTAALLFFAAFLDLGRCAYEYSEGLIGFNKRKQSVIYVLRWSEIKSTDFSISRYGASYFVANAQGRFPVFTRALWRRCREAAASNYERDRVMTLDANAGIYVGSIMVEPERPGAKPAQIETIAVHKQVYEEELARQGQEVEQSVYWLPRSNGATIYFRGKYDPSTLSWILEGKSAGIDVPPDALPTLEQVKACVWALFSTLVVERRPLDFAGIEEGTFHQRLLVIARRQNRGSYDPTVREVLTLAKGINQRLRGKGRKAPIPGRSPDA